MPDGKNISPTRWFSPVLLLRGCVLGLVVVLILELTYSLLGANLREVAPGLVYRCAKLSGKRLESVIRQHGIRTVINLCGCCDPVPWYRDEARTLNRLNVSMEDLGCSAARLPSPHTIRELVKILDQTEYPILVHCHRGIDRTGLVSAVALLLHSDIGLEEGLAQLSWRYAHLSIGKTGNMDRFFRLYREWLASNGQQHNRDVFRRWLESDYCPGECKACYEVLDVKPGVLKAGPGQFMDSVIKLPAQTPSALRVRCTNTSVKPWHFKPGTSAGIHLQYMIQEVRTTASYSSRAGLFYATVAPGESIELTIALPSLRPGRYMLRADLLDEQHASFFQVGSEPLSREIEIE